MTNSINSTFGNSLFPYNLVAVVQFQHNIGRIAGDGLGVTVDLNVLKNESLVPCGVKGGPNDLCGLADV